MWIEMLRVGVGLAALAVLLFWTIRRLSGDGDDPSISYSSSSETGSKSVLLSGSYAVLGVAGVVGIAFWPELSSGGNVALGAVLGVVVVAHWILEKRERD